MTTLYHAGHIDHTIAGANGTVTISPSAEAYIYISDGAGEVLVPADVLGAPGVVGINHSGPIRVHFYGGIGTIDVAFGEGLSELGLAAGGKDKLVKSVWLKKPNRA